MSEVMERIKKDALERVLKKNDGNEDFLLYLDHSIFNKGEELDIVTDKIKFAHPTYLVFSDDEPQKNFAHRCHYLLYNGDNGEFIKIIPAEFPYFLRRKPDSLELFKDSQLTDRFKRKKKMKVDLNPASLSAYLKLSPFPLKFLLTGRRFAILFSGASNGRHVNDMEFLYRTLLDVYGFAAGDIYVLNYDGTLDYNTMPWETAAGLGFAPDGSAFRLQLSGGGNRTDFQAVLADIGSRIGTNDLLFIHTNNHGGWDAVQNDGFLVTLGENYYARDFAADLATLPSYKTLLVTMEQCHAGAFLQPVMNNSTALDTVFQAAVPWNQSSAGGWPFDPWAEMWISAMAGVRGDGSALAVSPDDDLNNLISAWEAYDSSLHIDNPVISESSNDLSKNVYLSRTIVKVKEIKEFKEVKEHKEFKEFKEPKEIKEFKEPKEIKEIKEPKEVKEFKEPKEIMEPKRIRETDPYIPIDPVKDIQIKIEERLDRLEKAVGKLTPFIKKEERPDLRKTNNEDDN